MPRYRRERLLVLGIFTAVENHRHVWSGGTQGGKPFGSLGPDNGLDGLNGIGLADRKMLVLVGFDQRRISISSYSGVFGLA